MQSAEEFVDFLEDECSKNMQEGPLYRLDSRIAASAIRARDKEIVEKCKAKIKETFVYSTQSRAIAALNDVLRDPG